MDISPAAISFFSVFISVGISVFSAGRMTGRIASKVDQVEKAQLKTESRIENCMQKPDCTLRHENFCLKVEDLKAAINKLEERNEERQKRADEQHMEFSRLVGSFEQFIKSHNEMSGNL